MSYRLSIFLFAIVIIGIISCKNNDEVFKTISTVQLNVVNASADTLNYYLNGTRQNNSSSLFPGGQTLYLTEPAGTQTYQFKKAGASSILFGVPLTLTGLANTLYVTGESAGQAFSTIDTLIVDSALVAVRFVNASPDAGNLSVTVGDTVKFRSRAYKTSSVFLPTGSGQKEVKVYLTGSSTPMIDTTITMNPFSGYTLFSRGLVNGKGNSAFKLGIALNFGN